MKKAMMMVLMVVSAQTAFAANGSLLDNALSENLMEKHQLQVGHNDTQERPKSIRGDKSTAKYQVIEVGDEMGSFASAKTQTHDDKSVKTNADAAKELSEINAEVSDSTL